MPTAKDLPADQAPCPACGGQSRFWFDKTIEGEAFPIRSCRDCKSAFVIPRPSANRLNALYTGELTVADDASQSCESADLGTDHTDAYQVARHCWRLANGREFLDVGAGNGEYSYTALKAGFRVTAIEPDAKRTRTFTRRNGFAPQNTFFDASFASNHARTYDVVLISHVLEHLPQPDTTVEHLATVLKPGGILAVCVPHFRSWMSRLLGKRDFFISPPYHLNCFTRNGLRHLVRSHALNEVHSETVTWFDDHRVRRRFGGAVVGTAAVVGLKGFFALADAWDGGNVLESYFRKQDA